MGDAIHVDDLVAYTVVQAEPGSAFVLAIGTSEPERLGVGALPATRSENSMAWVLRPSADGGTRLLLRMRADGADTGFARWVWNGSFNLGERRRAAAIAAQAIGT